VPDLLEKKSSIEVEVEVENENEEVGSETNFVMPTD
jgi:hypothetical protein